MNRHSMFSSEIGLYRLSRVLEFCLIVDLDMIKWKWSEIVLGIICFSLVNILFIRIKTKLTTIMTCYYIDSKYSIKYNI